ncbi:MAG TPA: hypothetical protein DCO68_08515 [Methylophilaceae bacterium]|nr:hypothetical protein [Methylophilaceae bacterium]HAJ72109.1 hypothetical protein [Methylophilaceae bacterium]
MLQKITVKLLPLCLMLVSACSTVDKLNPFHKNSKELSKNPENATTYVCDSNKRFVLQIIHQGKDAWLIYPDHEVNLNQVEGSQRYTSGAISLELNGDETKLNDGENIAYTGCKAQIKK